MDMDTQEAELSSQLENLTINSPRKLRSNAHSNSGKVFKEYESNHDFQDSNFTSQVVEPAISDSVKKPPTMTVLNNYSTVHQKVPSGFSGTTATSHQEAQWKQYFPGIGSGGGTNFGGAVGTANKVPESDLIVSDLVKDLSGVLETNTFKRHLDMKNKTTTMQTHENHDTISISHSKDFFNAEKVSSSFSDDSDSGPAAEAHDVFDGILQKQKSNYLVGSYPSNSNSNNNNNNNNNINNNININNKDNARTKEDDEENTSNSFEFSSSSSMSSSQTQSGRKSKVLKKPPLNTISPGQLGYQFNHTHGAWDPPLNQGLDVSSSHSLDNTSSNQSQFATMVPTGDNHTNGKAPSILDKKAYELTSTKPGDVGYRQKKIQEEENLANSDDTPLDTPKFNDLFTKNGTRAKVKGQMRTSRSISNSNLLEAHKKLKTFPAERVEDITSISEVNTSFNETEKQLISILTSKLSGSPSYDSDWEKILKVDLSRGKLKNMFGMQRLLPNVLVLNLSDNEMNTLEGIPSNVVQLFCSNNKITSAHCSLAGFHDLECLDLSYNLLNTSLKFLSLCHHLQEVNLSYNSIQSLEGIGSSRMKKLNLSNNEINGIIDFEQLILTNNSVVGGWLTVEVLDLSNNNIIGVRNINCLPRLKVLNLNGNPLVSIVESSKIENGTLRALSIKNTGGALSKLQNYKLDDQFTFPYQNLKILKLDGFAQLSKWQKWPGTLQILEINGGLASSLPRFSSLKSTNLYSLTIANVRDFTHLPVDLSKELPFLQELHLPGNNLQNAHKLTKTLPRQSVKFLDLRNNPITTPRHDRASTSLHYRQLLQLAGLCQQQCPALATLWLDDTPAPTATNL
ncbi:CMF_HP2_G0047900.mRNA.1.CDS.1 [Saccharomyces cerevisiae]|nr:CMF_HP2_G0047900.mRNA.1.CDS.1 [Saccharomyces cerevisiae]CAI6759450.1 CMF_HP2_G0047900.mRNA.1.CDS.1 [Saccharomyces cerevisiae]CAI6812042.1 CMF_HP1_G0053900.mRNA.1.CDS.1 [Saccharomyces cerevisiae]CAI7473977.1 CMF_collapsed_G0053150.mRNA.1.CDS.1 [Saccharomyces cerevisiae]